eukprot:1963102-Pleurochrysis_carterae.AAC.2
MDKHFIETPFEQNLPMILAGLGARKTNDHASSRARMRSKGPATSQSAALANCRSRTRTLDFA